MTIDEAQTMLNARAKCIEKVCRGIYEDCNKENCDNCDLCYAQGTNGEQKELMLQCVEWLEELKNYRDKNKMVVRIDCVNSEEFKDIAVKLAKEQYNKAIDDYKSGIKEELERFEVKNLDTCVLYDLMDRKAERLKAGGENDNLRR